LPSGESTVGPQAETGVESDQELNIGFQPRFPISTRSELTRVFVVHLRIQAEVVVIECR
jgi:hypothetical protein